tara:strand:+ start:2098 stop:2799 length:702 start_codon:yes stop_codon:yes gene_type:complete
MIKYIKESAKRYKESNLRFYEKPVHIVQPITNGVDLQQVLHDIESKVPKYLTNNFEALYVGNFDIFHKKNRSFNATFKDGAIYVTNRQDDYDDLVDDIVHEMAHSIERTPEFNELIYGDNSVESEFLAKRKTLYYLLDEPSSTMLYYLSPDYNKQFDNYLYTKIGYDKLRVISSGLFYSPYAITALKEYWANGFENYLVGDRQRLKDLSPALYKVVSKILSLDDSEIEYKKED